MEEALFTRISRLEAGNIIEALHAVFRQTQSALKPSKKSVAGAQKTQDDAPKIDKKALAQGLLALLQHAGTLAATDPALHKEVLIAVLEGLRQQPWLCDLFLRRHFEAFLTQPAAAQLITESVTQLDDALQARYFSALSAELRRLGAGNICMEYAPAVYHLRSAALSVICRCFRTVSHQLPFLGAAAHTSLTHQPSSSVEVQISLNQQFPSALQVLCTPSPDVPLSATVVMSSAASGVSEMEGGAVNASFSRAGDVQSTDLDENAAVYTATLAAHLCNVDFLYRILRANDMQQQHPHNGASGELSAAMARINKPTLQSIHAVMHVVPVVIEALLMHPDLADRIASQILADIGANSGASWASGANDGELNGPSSTQKTIISCLLVVRWELAQLLAAAGGARPLAKSCPAAWSLSTCTSLLHAMAAPSVSNAAQVSHALTMPPGVVAHALELVQQALPTWQAFATAAAGTFDSEVVPFLQSVLRLQGACFTGVFQPHAVVYPGPAHYEAMSMAQKLRALLVAADEEHQTERGPQALPLGAAAGGAPGNGVLLGSRKRSGAKLEGHQQAAKLQKLNGGVQGGDGAVADLLELLTAAPAEKPAPPENLAGGLHPSNTTGGLAPSESVPISSGGAGTSSEAQNLPTKPRKRITPQAIPCDTAAVHAPAGLNIGAAATGVEAGEGAAGPPDDTTPSWNTGRFVMSSTLDMDDTAREAMWTAYIADKERLVELLGDSSYREWYDEAAHPAPAANPSTGLDSAFDAIFGTAEDAVSTDVGPTLPQSILEASMLYPWQAALAASLFLIRDVAAAATAAVPARTSQVYGSLATIEERRNASAIALKVLDPNHSRNNWLSASKGAEAAAASGALLHFVLQLRTLLLRTSRRTTSPMLESYLTLARDMLHAALQAEASITLGSSGKAPTLPSSFIGPLVRGFSRYPPLLAGAVSAASAAALPCLAVVGVAPVESLIYSAAVLWLAVQARVQPSLPRPEWLLHQVPEATAHPIAAAVPAARAAAAASCLAQLSTSLDRVLVELDTPSAVATLLPAMDACAAAILCLQSESNTEAVERQDGGDESHSRRPPPPPPLLLGSMPSESSLLALSTALLTASASAADVFAALLDAGGEGDGGLGAVESLAGRLAVGLELADVTRALPQLLLVPSGRGGEISASSRVAVEAMENALEKADGAHASCLELLRSLKEESPAYVAAARGLDAAPALCLPLEKYQDQEEHEGGAVGPAFDAPPPPEKTFQEKANEKNSLALSSGDGRGLSAYQRRKRLQDIRNPYLRAIVAESRRAAGEAADGDLSDLEDFIVTNPERNYGAFIADHFPMAPDSEEEGEDEEGSESEDRDGGGVALVSLGGEGDPAPQAP